MAARAFDVPEDVPGGASSSTRRVSFYGNENEVPAASSTSASLGLSLRSPAFSPAPSAPGSIAARRRRSAGVGSLTPGGKPTGLASVNIYSDRFIPSRVSSNFEAASRISAEEEARTRQRSTPQPAAQAAATGSSNSPAQNTGLFTMLLRSELLGEDSFRPSSPNAGATGSPAGAASSTHEAAPRPSPRPPSQSAHQTPQLLRFRRRVLESPMTGGDAHNAAAQALGGDVSPLSPLRSSARKLLQQGSPGTPSVLAASQRKISKIPFKVLDAPGLADDFYLNVVDWSSRGVVGVGLDADVYLWSAHTARAANIWTVRQDQVASVSFTESGASLAVGTVAGKVLIFDVEKQALLRTIHNAHAGRIGCASWNGWVLATGSKDYGIKEFDTRLPDREAVIRTLTGHTQEVCGMKYSFEGLTGPHRQLASGGNDNKLLVWDARRADAPLHRFGDHIAAVKALAWSPHQTGVLASGGGTADRNIRVWSTLSGTALSAMDTGSQVCGLVYSKTCQELVSTHGYSLNQVCVWRCPSPSAPLHKIATLQGHSLRVLYLALSPDGSTVVTGAGDESLRFWNVWPGRASAGAVEPGSLASGAAGGLARTPMMSLR